MEKKMVEFKEWIKANKKKLVFIGISVTALGGVILGLKNREAIMELWELLQETIEDNAHKISLDIQGEKLTSTTIETIETRRSYTSSKVSYDVRQHIRMLPEGMHHSPEKALEAITLGIILLPNETIVDSYSKGDAA